MQFKRTPLSLAALFLYCAVVCAAPEGPWHGKLTIGLQRLNIVFNFEKDGSCTLDSPDQGAAGIPAEIIGSARDSVVVAVPSLQVLFRGKITGNSITGKFKQGPYTFPLTLRPGTVDLRRPQTPRPPFPYRTEDVEIDAGEAGLSATLTYPQHYDGTSRVPLVVMVSGSGLQNRDEEIMQHKPFAVIADFLARNGIASLRYDDRGFGQSTGPNEKATTQTYAEDACAAVEFARATGNFGPVGVLGHSEGGTIAFILGRRRKVDFAISMAGAAERGMDILERQNRRALLQAGISEEIAGAYCKALAEELCGHGAADSTSTAMIPEKLRANLKHIADNPSVWLRYFARYNPVEDIRGTRCPVFAFCGSKDTQVDAGANLGIISRELPRNNKNQIKVYEGLNHLMQHCRTGEVAEYNTIEETISPDVLRDIVDWVKSLSDDKY